MLVIPLYILLILYALFLLVFITFFFINLIHIVSTGTTTVGSFFVTLLVISFSAVTMLATWKYLPSADWKEPLISFDISSLTNIFQSGNGQYF
jgi:hypothetical protein